MTRIEKEKVLKDKFLDVSKGAENGLYTIEQIRALKDMAKEDVYPDWRFSDTDCNVWSILREGA